MAQSQQNLDTSNSSRCNTNTITTSTLRRRRGHIIGQINSFQKTMDQFTESQDIELLQVALESLEGYWTKFDDIQSDLEVLDSEEEARRYEIQNLYFQAVARARRYLRTSTTTSNPIAARNLRSPTNTLGGNVSARLPEISLPTFDGAYEQWTSFYDQFSSIIDRNEELTSSQKLQYLRSALKGRAASCIASLSTTDSNYATAIEILKNKFECTRKVILRHCDAIREYSKLPKDSPKALGELVDFFNQHLRALENLEQPVSSWNALLISTILSKLNTNTIWHWQLTLKNKDLPSYTQLLKFLEERADCAPAEPSHSNTIIARDNTQFNNNQRNTRSTSKKHVFIAQVQPCPVCKETHKIWMCNQFKNMSVDDRFNKITSLSLCSNCLGNGHSQSNCKSSSCRICQKRHHSLLHKTDPHSSNYEINQSATTTTNQSTATTENKGKHSAFVLDVATNDILVTAIINVVNNKNELVRGRVLIDTGATTNFMTESFAQTLGLPMGKCHFPVTGLNELNTVSKHTITATIKSRINNYNRTLSFLTVSQISPSIPNEPIDRTYIKIPQNIKLADPNFHCPAPIDILVGSGTSLSLLCVGQVNLTNHGTLDLYLQKTKLGWVIGGSAPTALTVKPQVHCTSLQMPNISKFWEIEDGPQERRLSPDEIACETHFVKTTTRDENGRYIVRLPFNTNKSKLGESYSQALTRFLSLERKFKRNAEFGKQYSAVISEYLTLGHLTKEKEDTQYDGYYLPHHAVIKTSSLTTKLRVVFDGSAKTSTGISLNDTLYVGPKLQDDLLHILLRFRIHRYVITGDIEKMYRQFLVHPEDRKFQKILWRDDKGKMQTYSLNTITFGLAAAPYLAIRCLQQLADNEMKNFPTAAKILKRDFYVDDALTGCSTIQEGIALREELKQILRAGGLNIRQWASNDQRLLEGVPHEDINKQLQLGEDSCTSLKTLGVRWNSETDSLHYTVEIKQLLDPISKRLICSQIARIYDPLGLLGPVIIKAKIILQKIWSLKLDWDESLPLDIHSEWINYYHKLPLLNNISFPRYTLVDQPADIELHGFCDASVKGYGACIYLRSTTEEGQINTHLLIAKSKVAPLKQQTIPRLELCGALLLATLTSAIQKALPINIKRVILWTDSTIVLNWVHTSPHLLKTFVANRVAEITRHTTPNHWRHVRTIDNPADLISRGVTAEEFLSATIWYSGPKWLSQNETQWPVLNIPSTTEIPEQRKQICLSLNTEKTDIYNKYSSWIRTQRIIAYCLRWRQNGTKGASLSTTELTKSRTIILKQLQHQHFWTRWQKEYLNELIQRNKWHSGSHNINQGTMVLLKEDNTPPQHWILGRVLQIHPGADGITRTVTVKTATNVFIRSVKNLAPLPITQNEEEISNNS